MQHGGTSIDDAFASFSPVDPPLGGDDDFISLAVNNLGNQAFTFPVSSVAIGRVEKVDTGVEAGLERGQAVAIIDIEACHASDWPASKTNG